MRVERLIGGRPIGTLTPMTQRANQGVDHMVVHRTERHPRITVVKVHSPASQQTVHQFEQSRQWGHRMLRQQLAKFLVETQHGLLRGEYIQIASIAAMKVAIVSKREPPPTPVTATDRLFVPEPCSVPAYAPRPPHGALRFLINLSAPAVPFTPESLSDACSLLLRQ